MNAPIDARALLVRASIAAAFASGAWYVAVAPMRNDLVNARKQLTADLQELATADEHPNEPTGRSHTQLNQRIGALEKYTTSTQNVGRLYDALHSLADRTGVRLERVDPRGVQESRDIAGGARLPYASASYSSDITGTYAQVTDFLRGIEETMGMSRVHSFRITPGTNGLVNATVDSQHFYVSMAAANGSHP